MNLNKLIFTENPCYKAGKKITVKGIMVHSTGANNPWLKRYVGPDDGKLGKNQYNNHWNQEMDRSVCVHGFIGKLADGNIATYQTLPWDMRGWHAASGKNGSANNTHIGFEICEDGLTDSTYFKKVYQEAVELCVYLCKEFDLTEKNIICHSEGYAQGIASNHGDVMHWFPKHGKSMDTFRAEVKALLEKESTGASAPVSGIQASEFAELSDEAVIAKVGPLATADMKKTGVLASITLAQFILESGYGKSELAQKANNCFGMKKSLSGNTWGGSAWDGTSIYTKQTKEQNADGSYETITADFRKYSKVEDSIADHSAYLLGAKKGNALRYAGIQGMTDYRAAAQLIKDGGYATSLTYVEKLCSIVERWNLTQYDVAAEAPVVKEWYRVRKSWADASSQKGAFRELKYAKSCADQNPGYSVFDNDGKAIYPVTANTGSSGGSTTAFAPYRVRVSIADLNIRKGPGTDKARTGKYTGKGVFTIVDEADGKGATRWGLLKSYAEKRNGWISLDYCQKL